MAELDLGRIRFFDKGEHSVGAEYVLWDFVTSNGSTYLYINKANSTGKPLTDEFYWKCLAKRGLSAFEVWDIMNGGNKTEAQFFDFIQSPANDAKNDYNTVVKPAIQTQGVYAQAQGDYAKAQGEAIQDDLALKADQADLVQLESDVEQLAYVKIKNEAVNGNFENGLIAPFRRTDGVGGASTLAINSSTPISGNYDIRLTITTPSTSSRPIFNGLDGAGNIGDKIYLHFYAKILSGTPNIRSISDGEGTPAIYAGNVINGRNTRIIDVVGTGNLLGVIYFSSPSVWDMQMDNFMRINLTETFGEGNEPTEEEMNLLISTLGIDYFEGEITVPSQKIMQWQLKLIRKNKNAIIALGGTII